jgi:hypothetical protein
MEELFRHFESRGEQHVRDNLAAGHYVGFKRKCAVEWLERFERLRADASHSEEIEIARSAKDAAWDAAAAAREANRLAIQANKIAMTAATIAVVAAAAAILALFG